MKNSKKRLPAIALMMVLGCFLPPNPISCLHSQGDEETGRLKTEDISITLEGEGLWIRITPLDEGILRYTTIDTKRTYTTILKAHPDITDDMKQKTFLVLFQGRTEPETYFEPTEFELIQQGNRYKPEKIIPHSQSFDKRVLKFYGTPEMAIYLFSEKIDLEFPITFTYKSIESRKWESVVRTWKDAKSKY